MNRCIERTGDQGGLPTIIKAGVRLCRHESEFIDCRAMRRIPHESRALWTAATCRRFTVGRFVARYDWTSPSVQERRQVSAVQSRSVAASSFGMLRGVSRNGFIGHHVVQSGSSNLQRAGFTMAARSCYRRTFRSRDAASSKGLHVPRPPEYAGAAR